ncbi:MAG: hypothetical protein Q9226_007977 [Calogaya cf. arnoldii]
MATDVRNTFSGRLSLVGPQLQTLWQETLTTGYILKQAFSAAPTLQSSDSSIDISDSSIDTSDDEPSQHDQPPNPQEPIIAHANARREPYIQADKATETVCDTTAQARTSVAEGTTTTLPTPQREQSKALSESPSSSSVQSDDIPPSNANAATQTEERSPQTDYTSEFSGSPRKLDHGMDTDDDELSLFGHCEDNGPSAPPASLTSSERRNDRDAPELLDGPSQVIVASHNDQHCLALLITKKMIEYMNDITEDTKTLERLQAKFADVDQRVSHTRITVEYCEKLLEKAKTQEEIAELREDIERRRSTLPEDEKYHGAMQRKIGFAKARLDYSHAQSRSLLRQALSNAGLLQVQNEHDKEGQAEDDSVSQASESDAGYEAETRCSDISDISIEELAKRATREEVQAKYEEYLQAERNFDSRGEEYTHQKQLLEDGVLENSDHPMAQEILDLCFIEQEQELTRDLTAAEEAYEEARARARFFGPNEWDQESCFVTDEYDGYPLSWENDGIASTPSDLIYWWLEDIPDVENPPDIAELDTGAGQEFGQENQEDIEVCDIKSAQLSDAWSSHDCSRNRKRIDRWRAMTGRDR